MHLILNQPSTRFFFGSSLFTFSPLVTISSCVILLTENQKNCITKIDNKNFFFEFFVFQNFTRYLPSFIFGSFSIFGSTLSTTIKVSTQKCTQNLFMYYI